MTGDNYQDGRPKTFYQWLLNKYGHDEAQRRYDKWKREKYETKKSKRTLDKFNH